jgi:hypothetical protein
VLQPVRDGLVLRADEPALSGRDRLIGEEGERSRVAERAGVAAIAADAHGLGRILQHEEIAAPRQVRTGSMTDTVPQR